MKLITEEIEKVKVITEEKNGVKSLFIEGIFLQANKPNRNKRLYEMKTLEREVKRYNENFISKGRALGELGHPDGPTLNLDRVSHKITMLERKDDNFIGKAKILDTPMGKIASSLLDEGVMLGVSSRGVGSLIPTNEGYSLVGEDFMLATAADIVADPSAPDAFVNGIMEGREWIYDSNKKTWVAESIKNIIEKDVKQRKLTEQRKLQHFEKFLGML
jgi:hypothetical protein